VRVDLWAAASQRRNNLSGVDSLGGASREHEPESPASADTRVIPCVVAYEWALQPAAGGSAVVDRGSYMQVWKEQGDKTWRFAREVYNSSVPPAAVGAKR
jgi:hypothetical protein